jgi:hypothetical protein
MLREKYNALKTMPNNPFSERTQADEDKIEQSAIRFMGYSVAGVMAAVTVMSAKLLGEPYFIHPVIGMTVASLLALPALVIGRECITHSHLSFLRKQEP